MASFEDIQKDISDIVARLNADAALARAALINPVLALEALGIELDLEARLELDDRARFGKKEIARRQRLRKQLFKEAGRSFDPGDRDDLSAVLYDDLGLHDAVGKRPDTGALVPRPRLVRADMPKPKLRRMTAAESVAARRKGAKKRAARLPEPGLIAIETLADPLAILKDAHPVVRPLLEYRQIDAAAARFAPTSMFEAVRGGTRKLANVTPRAVTTGRG